MKKVALVFAIAVFIPSLALAWLAVRSLRDQQFLVERQQALLYQSVADSIAKEINDALANCQHDFALKVGDLTRGVSAKLPPATFDTRLRAAWPLAQVGFAVTLTGTLLCPSPTASPTCAVFCSDNGSFLANREAAEVYWNSKAVINSFNNSPSQVQEVLPNAAEQEKKNYAFKSQQAQTRNVTPQQMPQPVPSSKGNQEEQQQQQYSKVAPSETEFRQLIGDAAEGTLARFVDNRLNLMVWHRPPGSTVVYGAQLALDRLVETLKPVLLGAEPSVLQEVCIALLNDRARPAALSTDGFQANWKHPVVAAEVGEVLPHWEIAAYSLNPARINESVRTLKMTLGLLIGILLTAIAIGSWLIVTDLNRQLSLARQKTDFVSNVSHELKTPLTSIRMFSELLSEGRVTDPSKTRAYLGIITAETARLTRLINNVLDFSRLDRGEKKYNFVETNIADLARNTLDSYRPQLEANGFKVECFLPSDPVMVCGDRDALAQVLLNLISNAEKYSNGEKEISVRCEIHDDDPGAGPQSRRAEILVLDRGSGVPRGCEGKIFEQFYRANDSLANGVQGSGLGLTLARQIARAHSGDVVYEPRPGSGSCFRLCLPLADQKVESE
jgi:signal transduction histidine kinase